jgi:hypothetical protein
MRLLSTIIVLASLSYTPAANAIAQCMNFVGCKVSVTSDNANGKMCDTTSGYCTCSDLASGGPWHLESGGTRSCSSGFYEGATITGQKCCTGAWLNAQSAGPETEKVKGSSASIAAAFEPKLYANYYGYMGTTMRSPNTGRAVSIHARLDVCIGGGDTDAAIATMNANTCYNTYCGTSYNEYCNATVNNGGTTEAGGVCHDRCECAINGMTDSSCNQL